MYAASMKAKDLAALLMQDPNAEVFVHLPGNENAPSIRKVLHGTGSEDRANQRIFVLEQSEADWVFMPESELHPTV